MLAGHFGIAQLGKATRREIPFIWLVVAAYLPDLVRVPLTPLTTRHEILSHSLPAVSALALAIAALWLLRRGQLGAAAIIAIACALHWPADVFTGCKPTTFHGPWVGLISYRRPINDLVLEGALLLGGWLAARRRGVGLSKWWLVAGFVVQIGFLTSMYYGSEFFIGNHEWMWKPELSLVPQRHELETPRCAPPNEGDEKRTAFITRPALTYSAVMPPKQSTVLDARAVDRALRRMAVEIVELNAGTDDLIIVGIQRRGVQLAARIVSNISDREKAKVPLGALDITLYRDDLQTVGPRPVVGPTNIPADVDGRAVVIVDDVLYTGRTVRAALDELADFGRPKRIALAVLIDRGGRELPIQPDIVGKRVECASGQRVDVLVEELDQRDAVILSDREESA